MNRRECSREVSLQCNISQNLKNLTQSRAVEKLWKKELLSTVGGIQVSETSLESKFVIPAKSKPTYIFT
jgi:hypothetical protein